MLSVRPRNLVCQLILVGYTVSRTENSQDSVPPGKNRECRRFGDPGTHGRNSQNRVIAIGRRRRVLRGEISLIGHATFVHHRVVQNRSPLQHDIGVAEPYLRWRSRQLSVQRNHLRIFRDEEAARQGVLGVDHVIAVGHFLITVIDRRAAENGLPVTQRAGTREEIAAVVELDVENIQRHWIDVRSVAGHVRTAKGTEVSIAGMIRRTV